MKKDVEAYRPRQPLDEERKALFLRVLSETSSFSAAARAASPHTKTGALQTFVDEAKRDPKFQAAISESLETYKATVLAALHERAITGWLEPVYSSKGFRSKDHDGSPATVRKYSDKALELALRRKSLWNDEFGTAARVESSGTITHEHTVPRLDLTEREIFALPAEDRRDLARILRRIAEMRNEPQELVDKQAAQLIEHQATDATFEEVVDPIREPWEDMI